MSKAQKARKENSKILCSSMNSNMSGIPDFETTLTPIPKKDSKKNPKGTIPKDNLQQQDFYVKYLRSIYLNAVMEDKYRKDKSELENQLTSLQQELKQQKCMLEKSVKQLKAVSINAERELILKDLNSRYDSVLDILDSNHLENTNKITNRLNTLRDIVPTCNIEVPQSSSEIAGEFQKMLDALNHLNTIARPADPHLRTYRQVSNAVDSITENQNATANDIKDFENLKSSVRDELLLYCSHEKSRLLEQKLEEAKEDPCDDTMSALKYIHDNLKDLNGDA